MNEIKISLFSLGKFMIAMCLLMLSMALTIALIWIIFVEADSPIALTIFNIVALIIFIPVILTISVHFLKVATKAVLIKEEGIFIKNFISELYSLKWNEIKNIYVLDFPGAQKYTVPGLIRGGPSATHKASIYRYFKYPEKWIVIDSHRRSPLHLKDDNTKLQFLLSPINIYSVIKFKYDEECLNEISKFYTKYLTNIGVLKEIKNISFNVTDELTDSKGINDFYEFLNMLDVGDKEAVERLDTYLLPEFHKIWLERRDIMK